MQTIKNQNIFTLKFYEFYLKQWNGVKVLVPRGWPELALKSLKLCPARLLCFLHALVCIKLSFSLKAPRPLRVMPCVVILHYRVLPVNKRHAKEAGLGQVTFAAVSGKWLDIDDFILDSGFTCILDWLPGAGGTMTTWQNIGPESRARQEAPPAPATSATALSLEPRYSAVRARSK